MLIGADVPIDTRNARASAILSALPWRGALPLPDATVGPTDRQQVAYVYVGILATPFVPGLGASALFVTLPWRLAVPLPDGTIARPDRQQLAFAYIGAIAPPPIRGVATYLNGVLQLRKILRGMQIDDILNTRQVCRFGVYRAPGSPAIDVGMEVLVEDDGVRIFGGTIEDPEAESYQANADEITVVVEAVGFSQIADRVEPVAQVFENELAGDIVRWIVANHLAADGVTDTGVEDGPIVAKAVFNFLAPSRCFDRLAEAVGFSWYIDAHRDLKFGSRDSQAAPWAADGVSDLVSKVVVRRTREEYRNVQYLRAGEEVSDPRTETLVGDGERRTFTLSRPMATSPTIEVNGLGETVGILNVSVGKQWYWNKGENVVTQDEGEPVLTGADTLSVEYRYLYPIRVRAQRDEAIVDRAAVEGGSGIYAQVTDMPEIDDAGMAEEAAIAKLRRYGQIPAVVTLQTTRHGLRAGQLLPITRAQHNIAGDFLIERVQASVTFAGTGLVKYSVTALDGEHLGGWTRFWKELLEAKREFVIADNEVLILIRLTRDGVICGDVLDLPVEAAPESRIDFATVDYSEVAA